MNLYSEYSDQTLVVLIVSNDQRAFAEIYRRYWDKMFVVAFNRLRDQFEAEETVQEIFVKLWTRRTELQITQNLSSYFAVAVKYVLLLFSGCFEDRKILFNHQVLEWQPPNRATNALTANVNFDTDETNTKTVTLKIQYAGAHVSHNINAVFDVHTGETTAVEGQHFRILGSKTLIIPPNSSESNSVTIEILGASFENGENKRIVLRISDDSDYDPMVNYRDFVININKKAEEPGPDPMAVVSVTMDRPGTNSNTKRMLDVITGTTYSFTAANDDPSLRDVVDFAIFRGASAGLMLISTGDKSPGTSEGLGRFTGGRTIRDEWQKKNDGDFMRLPSTKGGNQSIFDVIST